MKFPQFAYITTLLLFCLTFTQSTVLAQEQPPDQTVQPASVMADAQNVRLLSESGGAMGALFFVGSRAYLGEGYRVTVLDWSDPAQPTVLGHTPLLPDTISNLVVVDNYAYVADDRGGLRIFNMSNPAQPNQVGHYDVDGITQVAVAGNLALVGERYADGGGVLHLLSVQNRAAPTELGHYDSPDDIGKVVVVGNLAYFNDTSGLRILDISNPAAPSEVGYFAVTGGLNEFQISGGYAYLAAGANGLRILDLNTPTAPQEVGFYDTPGDAQEVQVSKGQAYIVDGSTRLYTVDVSKPTAPTLSSSYATGTTLRRIFVVGSSLYGIDNLNQLRLYDATDPTRILRKGLYAAPGYAVSITASGFSGDQYLYVAEDAYGLRIMKIEPPDNPVAVSLYQTPDYALGVAVDFNYAYVAAYGSGLRIIDINDPANPREVGFYDTPGLARDVKLFGGYAYVADGAGGLRIVDVRTPTAPTEVGFYDSYGFGNGVMGLDLVNKGNSTYAYLADGNLRILNVTNRASPQQVGFYTTPSSAIAVEVVGDYAYVLDYDHYLRVINISNPAAPTQTSAYQYLLSGAITFSDDIRVVGNLAYITDGGSTLRVINIANPAAPTEIGYYDFIQGIKGLYVSDRTIYVAGRAAGLYTMHYPDCYQLTVQHTGEGVDPLLTPDNSPGCPTGQYVPQGFVTLSANPASTWRVDRWLGTDSDSSTLTTNKLTMPASDFGVTVFYGTDCYPLSLTKSGEGSPPVATPANSPTCPAGQYIAGAALTLHADPAAGWRMAGWTGADDTTSLSTDNTLVMPVGNHTVSVAYGQLPVTVTGDAYEEDDSCAQARTLNSDGVAQTHTFHRAGDEDWLRFAAVAGLRYRIEATIPADSPADVKLELYGACAGAPVEDFNASFAPGVRLDITATTSAPIYLRLNDVDAEAGGPERVYEVSVRPVETPRSTQSNQALILVGGSYKNPDSLQENINHVTNAVYAYFRASGYSGADITYLTNDASVVNRNGAATLEALQAAITVWAKTRLRIGGALTLYLMDHGDEDKFYLDNAQSQVLTPQQLDGWLDQLEAAVPELKITVIIEACHSGSFIDGDQSISKDEPNRLVLTSTSDTLLAYASANGAYFSDLMVATLEQGYSLHNSFRATYGAVRELSQLLQEPWIDGNGNGIPNEPADITLATQHATSASAAGGGDQGWAPYIVSANGPATIVDRHGVLQAVVRDDKAVRRVWAVITPPSYHPPQQSAELVPETLPTIVLTPQGDDAFAAEYTGFDEMGVYRVALYAEDNDNLVSLPTIIEVFNGSRLFLPLVSR
ncbi:MAG: C13 family peptidase [Caldilineaceae bacterium]